MKLKWNPAILVWLVLCVATVLSWHLGNEQRLDHEAIHWASVWILLIAAVKARLILIHFMELSIAPRIWRWVFEVWVAGGCAVFCYIYISGSATSL